MRNWFFYLKKKVLCLSEIWVICYKMKLNSCLTLNNQLFICCGSSQKILRFESWIEIFLESCNWYGWLVVGLWNSLRKTLKSHCNAYYNTLTCCIPFTTGFATNFFFVAARRIKSWPKTRNKIDLKSTQVLI